MGEFVVDAAFAYLGALDLSESLTDWTMPASGDALDKTTMRNSGARRFRMGLITTSVTLGGFVDMTTADPLLMAGFQARATRALIVGNEEAEGQPCCLMNVVKPTFQQHAGQVGQLPKYSVGAQSTDKYGGVRGVLLLEQQTVSTTGAKGTAFQLGATSATQHLFAALNLMGTVGTSITVVLESDADNTFGSPTTRVTFGPLTALGGNWATPVAGAITDEWYRFRVTAVTGSWTVGGAAAIE